MTIQTLPDDPNYAFCPSYDLGDEPQQIRIVFEGVEGYAPTALVALTAISALSPVLIGRPDWRKTFVAARSGTLLRRR